MTDDRKTERERLRRAAADYDDARAGGEPCIGPGVEARQIYRALFVPETVLGLLDDIERLERELQAARADSARIEWIAANAEWQHGDGERAGYLWPMMIESDEARCSADELRELCERLTADLAELAALIADSEPIRTDA